MQVWTGEDGPRVLLSVTDLVAAATCEFGVIRALDAKLGRASELIAPKNVLMARVGELGRQHEARLVAAYRAQFGDHHGTRGGVLVLGRPRSSTHLDLQAAMADTLEALHTGPDVLCQGTVFDGGMVGHPDFLRRCGDDYVVEEAKIARSVKPLALLQIAAYAEMLLSAGIEVTAQARLLLGDGSVSVHDLADHIPSYREARVRLEQTVQTHLAEVDPVQWRDPRYRACGRCPTCAVQIEATRDVLLVAGMRTTHRNALHAAGINTIEELAASTVEIDRLPMTKLRRQATLQVEQDARTASGDTRADGWPIVRHEIIDLAALQRIPDLNTGDLFFDFEGDPFWGADGPEWGLEYLFGVCNAEGAYQTWWAHDRMQERDALIEFIDFLVDRRRMSPQLHVYHYAAYETNALKRLTSRYEVCEEKLAQLLSAGVFVDLYAVVHAGVRISQRSYSLKALEPIYMRERRVDLDNAGDSIAMYAEATRLHALGCDEQAEELLLQIEHYNAYDVHSTLALRDWLLSLRP